LRHSWFCSAVANESSGKKRFDDEALSGFWLCLLNIINEGRKKRESAEQKAEFKH
jgi:hypothetical protein